jgi:ribosomal protein S18 acetylase RimI-like enzyme
MLEVLPATTPEHIEEVRSLFLEYEKSIGISLCFQNFEEEVRELPGNYNTPHGTLLLAFHNGSAAGCCALRSFMNPPYQEAAEMKRLYVRPSFRGKGIARLLIGEIIRAAIQKRYSTILLDTLPSMKEAQGLYQRLGFVEIPPYYPNPILGTTYLKLDLLKSVSPD